MATILSDEQCKQIDFYRRKLRPYYSRGWMCEGGEYEVDGNYLPCNVIFNNDTDEWFKADYNGNIITGALTITSAMDAKTMAILEGKIRRV